MTVTIFHNPACSTSRAVLARIRDAGIEPSIVAYLVTPPTAEALRRLATAAGVPVRALLRTKEPLASELGLVDTDRGDDDILEAIAAHPILLQRPIVATPHAAAVCRPAERVDALLRTPSAR